MSSLSTTVKEEQKAMCNWVSQHGSNESAEDIAILKEQIAVWCSSHESEIEQSISSHQAALQEASAVKTPIVRKLKKGLSDQQLFRRWYRNSAKNGGI